MRLFIALEIPSPFLSQIEAIQSLLKKRLKNAPLRFVEPQNLHLTLKFIGEVSPEKALNIQRILRQVQYPCFRLPFTGGGTFPYGKMVPRVLYLALGDEALIRFASLLELELKSLGIERDPNAFKGHLTLARVKGHMHPGQVEIFKELTSNFKGSFQVREFFLYESQLASSGPTYKKVESYSLKEKE